MDHHYSDFEYLTRLRDLDLLPMELKFRFTDLIFFHQVYNDRSVVKLPSYLTPITCSDRSRLRLNTPQPVRLHDPDGEPSRLHSTSQRRVNRHDQYSLRCTMETKSPSFRGGFFFRTHSEWNELPTDLKISSDAAVFKLQREVKTASMGCCTDPRVMTTSM